MNPNFISEVGAELNFCRSYIIRYEVILQVKLCWIYEDNRSFSNGTDLKFKFKIFNMVVDFTQNFMYNPKMNSNFIFEVGAEWNFCRSYIIRYEVILQVKLSYFSLLKDN